MKYLHAMVRVRDLEASMAFFSDALGLIETRRNDYPAGRFTLVYLTAPENPSIARRATVAWPSSGRRTRYRLNCCRRARRCFQPSPGCRCPISAPGDARRKQPLAERLGQVVDQVFDVFQADRKAQQVLR